MAGEPKGGRAGCKCFIIIYDKSMGTVASLPALLRERRTALGLTLARVARRAGTSAATLCRYERGWSRFELPTLRRLAAALNCRLDVRLVPVVVPPARRGPTGFARLRRLFWDRRLVEGDIGRHAAWVVGRVVEHGDLEDVRWLAAKLGTDRFLTLTADVRYSSARAARLWEGIRDMEGIECTRRRSRPAAGQSWRR
jgi:transcriptional regulator with XRE-family HTH domain